MVISLSPNGEFIIFVFSKLNMSGVNPYINPTCPSSRFCKNHKYNTEGLFTGFYNENSSIHCGQQNMELPRYQKSMGGSALPGNVYTNISPGEQLVANNGVEFTDIYTNSAMAGMRTGFVELEKNPSINLSAKTSPKKEGFNTAFSTEPGGSEPGFMMTSSTVVEPLLSSIDKPAAKTTAEKFCSACASPCGCTVLGIIVAILVVWLLIKWFNRWSKEHTGRKIFKGGSFKSIKWGSSSAGSGNMNLLGGGDEEPAEGETGEESGSNEFSII